MALVCQKCGEPSDDEAVVCRACDGPLTTPAVMTGGIPPSPPLPADSPWMNTAVHSGYAGFWLRVAATMIDCILIILVTLPFNAYGRFLPDAFQSILLKTTTPTIWLLKSVVSFTISWLYRTLMICSPLQATVGKLAFRLKVTDLHGERIGFGRANIRFFILYGIVFAGALTIFSSGHRASIVLSAWVPLSVAWQLPGPGGNRPCTISLPVRWW